MFNKTTSAKVQHNKKPFLLLFAGQKSKYHLKTGTAAATFRQNIVQSQ